MSKIFKIILAIITVLIILGCLFGVYWGFNNGELLLSFVCLLLSCGFGFFSYKDYQYFFNKK